MAADSLANFATHANALKNVIPVEFHRTQSEMYRVSTSVPRLKNQVPSHVESAPY